LLDGAGTSASALLGPFEQEQPTAKIVTALARETRWLRLGIGVESERELKAAKDRTAA